MKYKYIATEQSLDVRHFEIFSDKKLEETQIEDALCLPDICKEGDVKTKEGVQVTFKRTEHGDDSYVKFYQESFKHTIQVIKGGQR
jgi:hypothetical protein|tara:strand:+ start:473 stop:730 length:258 start_codon:yes stop_codon:yes gene_type:complete